jgi:hypothetical protein
MGKAIDDFVGAFDKALTKLLQESAQPLDETTSPEVKQTRDLAVQRYEKINNAGGGASWFDAFMHLTDKYYLKSKELDDYVKSISGVSLQSPTTLWYEKMLDYESKHGLADGSPHPNYGFNPPFVQKYGVTMPNTMDDAKKVFETTILPKISSYPDGVQAQIGDFLFNTGKDARIYLLAQRNLITAAKRIAYKDAMVDGEWVDKTLEADFNAAWTASGIDLSTANPLDISDLKQGRDFYYKNTNRINGQSNPAYTATWLGRVTLYDNPVGTSNTSVKSGNDVENGTSSTKSFSGAMTAFGYDKFKKYILQDGQKSANTFNDPGMNQRMGTGYIRNLAPQSEDDKDLIYLAFQEAGDNYKGPYTDKIVNPTTNNDTKTQKEVTKTEGGFNIHGTYTFEFRDFDVMKVVGPSGSMVLMPDGSSKDLGELTRYVDDVTNTEVDDKEVYRNPYLEEDYQALDDEYVEFQQENYNQVGLKLTKDFPTNPYDGQIYVKSAEVSYTYAADINAWIRYFPPAIVKTK